MLERCLIHQKLQNFSESCVLLLQIKWISRKVKKFTLFGTFLIQTSFRQFFIGEVSKKLHKQSQLIWPLPLMPL